MLDEASLSTLTMLDIGIRFLCLGQLLFYLIWLLVDSARQRSVSIQRGLLCALITCCMGAVLLTMHYRPPLIYALRPVLLALTDGLALVFWAFVISDLSSRKHSRSSTHLLRIAGGVYLLWHAYFFIINEGHGPLHDVIHGLAGVAVLHVIYTSIATWRDDLVDNRRRRRALFLVVACVAVLIYVVSELSGIRFMRSEMGSFLGAMFMLTLSLCFGIMAFLGLMPATPGGSQSDTAPISAIAKQHKVLYVRLSNFMESKGFVEPRLTLSRLAERLDTKEYRLRELINKGLGYRNFSQYLNAQRLPLACEKLRQHRDTSITDIALDLGYGSITSFNRAFKQEFGISPREYRAQQK